MSVRLEIVKISRLVPSKTNPRKHFDEADIQELASSIKSSGQIQAITVRPLDNDLLEIIDGERRWRALQLNLENEVKVEIGNYTDEQVLEIQMISFLQRKDVNPMEEAQALQNLLDAGKYNKETLADKVGKSQSYITKRLQLLKLIKDIQEALMTDQITIAHAIEFSRLNEKQQKESFKWAMSSSVVCRVYDLKGFITRSYHLDLKTAPFNTSDNKLMGACGVPACTQCKLRTGYNTNLFDDIENKDICTSPECFNNKCTAHLNQQIEKAEKAGKPLIKITTEYMYDDDKKKNPGILGRFDYNEVKKNKPCSSAQEAIIVKTSQYDTEHKIGQKTKICSDKKCPVHGNNSSQNRVTDARTPEEKAAKKKAAEELELKKKIIDQTNNQLLDEILPEIKFPFSDDWFLDFFFDNTLDVLCIRDEVFERHNIEGEYLDEDDMKKYAKGKSAIEKLKLLVEIILVDDMNNYPVENRGKIVRSIAPHYGINIKSIEKSIEKKLRAPEKKPAEEKKPGKSKKNLKIPVNEAA